MTNQEFQSEYTFENFVVGQSNKTVHWDALNVAQYPGEQRRNPLYLYGPEGLGKSHLLHAIRQRAISLGFSVKITDGIEMSKTGLNPDDYFEPQILIIDNLASLQDLPDRNELFSTILKRRLLERRQVVIADRIAPRFFTRFEEDVISRLQTGVVTSINYPNEELRMAILKARINSLQQKPLIPQETLTYISDRFADNTKLMIRALHSLITHWKIHQTLLSLEQAVAILSQNEKPSGIIDPSDIIRITADKYELTTEGLKRKDRSAKTALARHVAMYLMLEHTSLTLNAVGRELGGRDHSTVTHGYQRIDNLLKNDPNLVREISEIREALALS